MAKLSKTIPTHLKQHDLAYMLHADAECRAATLRLENVKLRSYIAQLQGEIDAQKIALKSHADKAQGDADALAAGAELSAKTKAQRSLAEELGARYDVDWADAAFDPLTGEIVRQIPGMKP